MVQGEPLVNLLEEAVYDHSRQIDRCKALLRRIAINKSAHKFHEVFTGLANASKRIELAVNRLSTLISQNMLPAEELERAVPLLFYVYEIAVEEEQDLWHRYRLFVPVADKELEEHLARLNKIKMVAQGILEAVQGIR